MPCTLSRGSTTVAAFGSMDRFAPGISGGCGQLPTAMPGPGSTMSLGQVVIAHPRLMLGRHRPASMGVVRGDDGAPLPGAMVGV